MKKVFGVLLLTAMLMAPLHSFALDLKEFTISLATTGTTTAASGTSTMIIGTSSATTVEITKPSDTFTCVVQLPSISSITPYEAGAAAVGGGDYSGTTFTLRYKESIVDSSDAWAAASATNVFNGTLLSGTTMRQVQIYPVAAGYIQFELISGITPLSRADFIVKIVD